MINKLKIRDLEFEMNPMVTFYDVLSFNYDGNEYDIQCQLCGNESRLSRIGWYQNGIEFHSDRFNMAYKAIIKATMDSPNPSNTISWSIAEKKFARIFAGLNKHNLHNHLKYMMGLYYDVAPQSLEEENKKLFSNIQYHLEEE